MSEEHGRPFVRYQDFTPATIEYDEELAAYTVGRAEIDSFDRRHYLTLSVVVTEAQMIVHRPGLEQAIRQARTVVERLVMEYQAAAAQLTANQSQVYTLGGVRLR
jgi:hypothetical protein